MAGVELSADALAGFDFDHHTRGLRYPYTSRVSWPIPMDQLPSRAPPQRSPIMKRSTSPLPDRTQRYENHSHQQPQPFLLNPEWQMSDTSHMGYHLDTTFPQPYTDNYTVPFHTSPTDFMPTNPHVDTGLHMDGSYLPVASHMDGMPFNWQDLGQAFHNDLMAFPPQTGLQDMTMPSHGIPEHSSPSDTYLEVRSLTSSGSDNGWATIDYQQQSLDSSMPDPQAAGAIFNPSQTLHGRTFSDSSYSDLEQQSRQSWSSGFVEVPNAISSPSSDSHGELDFHHDHYHTHHHVHRCAEESQRPGPQPAVVTTSISRPINIKKSSSPQRSPTSTGRSSPPTRRQSRKTTATKSLKLPRRPSQVPKADIEKRIGRRKGPLRPEQRKQAGEIRKLGACLRCKFLKKTVSQQ